MEDHTFSRATHLTCLQHVKSAYNRVIAGCVPLGVDQLWITDIQETIRKNKPAMPKGQDIRSEMCG